VKRKVLIATVAAWAIAAIAQARDGLVQTAYAQDAAATRAPAVEMPPPSGEVLPPAPSTISAPAGPTTMFAPTNPARTNRAKTASIERESPDSKDNGKDNAADNSPFGGFDNKSNHGPINIKSDTMSFDYKKSVVVFSGHVHAVQSGNELSSNTLHVQMNKDSQIQEMIADGDVRMSQGQRWATGDHAVLDQTLHTVVLTGSPVVHDGKDQIAGSKITVFLQTNTSEVTDPRAVIFPRESKKPNNSEASATTPAQAGAGE
jgi:lipopolysaccharide export system protein LptA